ncbi:MAG: biotin/lipoyl-binding protein, partial [Burkholderiales bacterium]
MAPLLRSFGTVVLGLLERVRVLLEPLIRRVFGPPGAGELAAQAGFRSFEAEADEVMSRSSTHRAQLIVRAAVVAVLLLIVWASFANVDEVTRGDGKVVSSRQLQLLQSFDGGVVSAILVKEGQVVEKDQLLLKIDETRATSGVRE